MIEYGRRRRTLPAPPEVVWADLVERRSTGTRAWLVLRTGEVEPQVVESDRPSRVVWSSLWPERPNDLVLLEVEAAGGQTALTFSLPAAGDPPGESLTGHLRKRMSELLYADLRFSYGQ